MQHQFQFDTTLIQKWMEARLKPAEIENILKQEGLVADHIAGYLQQYKKLCCEGRNFKGFLYATIGALLGFLSCLLSIFNPFPAWYEFFLFGFTSVAILLVFRGLYFLFE